MTLKAPQRPNQETVHEPIYFILRLRLLRVCRLFLIDWELVVLFPSFFQTFGSRNFAICLKKEPYSSLKIV